MKDALIIDAVRTPIGRLGGSLSTIRADDLAALVIRKVLARSPNFDPEVIEDVILGCANQAGEDNRNIARMASLLAGLPTTVPGLTVNRLCASGLNAIALAANSLRLSDGEAYIAGGVEHMTRGPYVLSKAEQPFARSMELFDTSFGWRFINPEMKKSYGVDSMGETAEHVAREFDISREDQDKFALASQQKTLAAKDKGRLALEIIPVEVLQKKADPFLFEADEFPRPKTTLDALSLLKPAFTKDGSVTAGNSSGLNDGAAALLMANESTAEKFGLTPRARVVASAVTGVEPRIMGIGPVSATKKVLKKANLKLDDISVIELNEAFAAQSLACIRELGLSDDDPRINPNGGAIALGHPLGMSGARLVTTAMIELEVTKKKYALCTMCVGVGQGMAVIIERV